MDLDMTLVTRPRTSPTQRPKRFKAVQFMIMQTYCFWRLIRGNVYSYLMVHEIQSLYNFLTGSNCIKSNHSDQMREIFYYKQKSPGLKRIQRAKKTDFLLIKRISAASYKQI